MIKTIDKVISIQEEDMKKQKITIKDYEKYKITNTLAQFNIFQQVRSLYRTCIEEIVANDNSTIK